MTGSITYTNVRFKDNSEFPFDPWEKTSLETLQMVACADFAFGGRVTDIVEQGDNVSLVTKSGCLGCVDVSTYSGSKEDMRMTIKLAELVTLMSTGDGGEIAQKRALQTVEKNAWMNTPRILGMMAGMLIGEPRTHASLLMVLALESYGEVESSVKKAMHAGKTVGMKDLIAAYALAVDESIDFVEAINLAAPITKAA